MNKKEFLTKVVAELLDDDFAILLHRKDNIDGYGGWFGAEDGEREFVVALNNSMGFETALHEYCHYLQWKNNRVLWEKSALTYDILFEWIDKPVLDYTKDELDQSLHDILELEHDCEKLALNILKTENISDINVDSYIKAVNAYLWHYHINREKRIRPKKPIYTEDIISHMSPVFILDLNYYLDRNNLSDSMKYALMGGYIDDNLEKTQDGVAFGR
jgi:hypothetical protein